MFCHKKDAVLINNVQKRALRAVHGDFTLQMVDLLNLKGELAIHKKHLQILMLETFRSLNQANPTLNVGLILYEEAFL